MVVRRSIATQPDRNDRRTSSRVAPGPAVASARLPRRGMARRDSARPRPRTPAPGSSRAAAAAQKQNYVGTIVYQHGGRFETSRLVHLNDQGREFEKLVNLDGPAREVIRMNGEVRCYYPDAKVIRIEPRTFRNAFPSLSPQQQAALTDFYTFPDGRARARRGHRNAGLGVRAQGRPALWPQVLGGSGVGPAREGPHLRRAQRDDRAVRVHRDHDRREDRSRDGESDMAGDAARLDRCANRVRATPTRRTRDGPSPGCRPAS